MSKRLPTLEKATLSFIGMQACKKICRATSLLQQRIEIVDIRVVWKNGNGRDWRAA
jgi:hypothetical protein